MLCIVIVSFVIVLSINAVPLPDSSSLVISTTESGKEPQTSIKNVEDVNPKIYSMDIHTNITNRFATTLVTSKVRNLKDKPAETTFAIILPKNAFISQFEMEIKGTVYKAYVREKEEAKKIYDQAVAQGQGAAHVELSARDSKTFTVSVNIEPETKTIFRLIYEELLQRDLGFYELVTNIHPGQIVEDLSVKVYINETRNITFVNTPSLRTGNEISKNDENLNPLSDIKIVNSTTAVVSFNPDAKQQKEFGQLLGVAKENGLGGQFVVQYDVERDPRGGEILVQDGYFVHFFSPSQLKPLKKHIVFVLDHSGSMDGIKFEQLTEAMQKILPKLTPDDLFNIVRFDHGALVWNTSGNTFDRVPHGQTDFKLPEAVPGTEEYISAAKEIVKNQDDMGSTNILAGLRTGILLSRKTQKQFPNTYQPMIIFLTDGLPNEEVSSGDVITKLITEQNNGADKAAIFSLSFGFGADKNFLRDLSSKNLGFSRHIFEAADSSLQLQDFYSRISSPLLKNVTFKYVDDVTDVTETHHPLLFNGSELVVAGRTSQDNSKILDDVVAICTVGPVNFEAPVSHPVSSIERLWAYLTVKQILTERETAANKTELTKKALDLALKYSFVTEVSSLVVVKPNETDSSSDLKDTTSEDNSAWSGPGYASVGFSSSQQYLYSKTALSGNRIFGGQPQSFNIEYDALPEMEESEDSAVTTPNLDQTPIWLQLLSNSNNTITTSTGVYRLGSSGEDVTKPACSNAPANSTGVCTIIFDCPHIYQDVPDTNEFLKYHCSLKQLTGVCCPIL